MSGTVIFINGTSSSGKTSIIHALQEMLEQPYLDMGVDRFIFMLPKRYLARPLWDDVLGKAHGAGETGHLLISGMHHAILAAANRGLNGLVDHVLVEKAWVDECARLFAGLPAYLIGVRCPLEIVEERERSRKDRTLGQARLQYPVVHAYASYDLELDTSSMSAEECALQIIQRLNTPPLAFRRLNPECYNPTDV
jgi:chloramphenicol 3-O phosphotransferase